MSKKRIIAINLPQYHPFKENDEWWGKGFTEWTNVTKARPRFKGHYQPHLPADTGFYDLRLPEARQLQADLASEYGIYGFCYYHYWFNGKHLMERPVNDILKSGEPDFPFMLCWANENWARNWDGGFKKLLMEQHYSEEDDANHMKWLCKNVFTDKRYIRINGKPFFAVYRPNDFPDLGKTVKIWRRVAAQFGMDLYLGFMEKLETKDPNNILDQGFDVSIEFQPQFYRHPYAMRNSISWFWYRFMKKMHLKTKLIMDCNIWDYDEYVEKQLVKEKVQYKQFPCIVPQWDNSPRRVEKQFWALHGSTPQLYGKWLQHIFKTFKPYSEEENFIFVNAWNEWAEGNHLEPDQRWGRKYLEETKKIIDLDL